MTDWLGLKPVDLAVIAGYFALVTAVGFWVARRVKDETDFFLGGRRFGKALLVMHWLCTGTHSDSAVQVAGATARLGLGGIWQQWMWMFATPFYWLIAPIMRRLRVITTGDVFRIRYGRSLELLYALVAAVYLVVSIAMLLRGAGAAISGATGGALSTDWTVPLLALLFSSYVMAGGLVSAAYTDFLQGALIVVLSVLLVPFGLAAIGGLEGLHKALSAETFAITAPAGSPEGDVWYVLAISALGLAGIVAQPHVMTATGSGKTETEARVGMCYGNFIKRLLTIAWAFTGLVAIVHFRGHLDGYAAGSDAAVARGEELFGLAVRSFLGDGWRGLMIACLIAGVTSAETIMVVGSAVFTRNCYLHLAPGRSERHYLWVGRLASGATLAVSALVAWLAGSVMQLFFAGVDIVAFLGPAFWMGIVWRRANAPGAWASFVGGVAVWATFTFGTPYLSRLDLDASGLPPSGVSCVRFIRELGRAEQIALQLGVEFGLLIMVGLVTRPAARGRLDPFFARLLTPVGKEVEVRADVCVADDSLRGAATAFEAEDAALGLDGATFDYGKASGWGYTWPRRLGLELPRLTLFDWGGFLLAWALVAAMIGLLAFLARWGA